MTAINHFPPRLLVKNAGVDKDLFMAYALLNRLTKLVGGAEGVALMAADPELQEKVLIEVFTERAKGVDVVTPTIDEIDVSIEDVSKIFDWVGGHVINFLLQQMENAVKKGQHLKQRTQNLESIASGLANSTSLKPAALSSEQSLPL